MAPAPLPPPRIVDRRRALVAGGVGMAGLSLPTLFAADRLGTSKQAKSVILIVPWGGPCQLDTLDLKPNAPDTVRGEFKPVATAVPGTHVCEHLPLLAALAGEYSIVRSASHRISTHNPATNYVLTGHPPGAFDKELVPASRTDWPSLGCVLTRLRPPSQSLPGYVMEPCPLIDNNSFTGGQNAGFWGPSHDPFVINKDPSRNDFTVDGLDLPGDLTQARLEVRRELQEKLGGMTPHYERAYDLLRSSATRQAFDLRSEPAAVRERYGMSRYGQSVLLARRLIEAGVRLVLVSDTEINTNGRWDTHESGKYPAIRKQLGETDLALSALLDDLKVRGLLDSTIVLWMAEFGRTPKMKNGGGRDHWPQCYSFLIAGGGVPGGQVVGSSDRLAAFPRERPIVPEDIHATLYKLLGVPADTVIRDNLNRPLLLCDGTPIREFVPA